MGTDMDRRFPDRPFVAAVGEGLRGRGAAGAPGNRFESTYVEIEPEALDELGADEHLFPTRETQYLPDRSRSIVAENQSPDVGFRFSINPYRGCLHGCSYCYARPTHEYLGFDAGLDFESRILVKEEAPRLFREFLMRRSWVPEPIAMSGVTDPYQPAERRYRLTRGCLEVAFEFCQPIEIVTKNALVVRDLDVLAPMAAQKLVEVNVTITTLDPALARSMEPRTSIPEARVRAIRALSEAGVPVRVLISPVVPGLTEPEIPAILTAAREAGARSAGYAMLRLPLAVAPIFLDWLRRNVPGRADKIERRIREMRGGSLNESGFGKRMSGRGALVGGIQAMFDLWQVRLGLDCGLPGLDVSIFRRAEPGGTQLRLF